MENKKHEGKPMTPEALREHEKAFQDINECFDGLLKEEEKTHPYAKYMKLRQQELPL